MDVPQTPRNAERLETLRTLLDSASALLAEIAGDQVFARLTQVFTRIPRSEREAIVAILEREVQARLTTEAAAELTALSLHPNPAARLYTRVIADEPRPNPERALACAVRAIRVTHDALAPMKDEWKQIAREALAGVGPDERAGMARFAHGILALLEADDPNGSPAPG